MFTARLFEKNFFRFDDIKKAFEETKQASLNKTLYTLIEGQNLQFTSSNKKKYINKFLIMSCFT